MSVLHWAIFRAQNICEFHCSGAFCQTRSVRQVELGGSVWTVWKGVNFPSPHLLEFYWSPSVVLCFYWLQNEWAQGRKTGFWLANYTQEDYVIVLTSERLLVLLLERCFSWSEVLLLLRCEVVKPVYGLCSEGITVQDGGWRQIGKLCCFTAVGCTRDCGMNLEMPMVGQNKVSLLTLWVLCVRI